jgi:hypothetical protein
MLRCLGGFACLQSGRRHPSRGLGGRVDVDLHKDHIFAGELIVSF